MKKIDMKKLALLGLASGLLVSVQVSAEESEPANSEQESGVFVAKGCGANSCSGRKSSLTATRDNYSNDATDDTKGDAPKSDEAKTLTESELLSNLNERGKALYQSLDADGKALAIKLASKSCKGTNDCKGQGACKTAKNDCAGKNGCKGQSKCNFKDKNDAVKVAAQKMAEKRNKSLNSN